MFKNFLQKRENKIKEEDLERKKQARENLRKYLESIDVDILSGIFSEVYLRAFPDQKLIKEALLTKTSELREKFLKIKVTDMNFLVSAGVNKDGSIIFDRTFLNKSDSDFSEFLSTYIHELCHVVSAHRLGLENEEESTSHDNIFTPLNEAFTEILKDSIYKEYIKRSGDQVLLKEVPDKAYLQYREIFYIFVDGVTEQSGVSKDIILESLLGHYLRGDFAHLFKEMWNELDPENKIKLDDLRYNKSMLSELMYDIKCMLSKQNFKEEFNFILKN